MKIGERRKIFYVLLENFVKRSMKSIPFSTADKENIVFFFLAELKCLYGKTPKSYRPKYTLKAKFSF
jgi:hypothetical protein